MRTLKKTLCLVLCLVMMVGLVAISANAAYKDEEKIEYAEAVGVLSMIKVLEGYEDGSFRPEGTLTRAEAAAMMSRLLNAKGEGPKVSSFTDMAAAEWAQPYVAYCEAAGIIAGFGDGTFHPMEKLTTAQFAKMLLCAIGYDAEREGLVNDTAWEINTVKLVNTIDLAEGISVITWDSAEYITRDQAAQLAFNTLLADMVEYDANGIYFLKDGTATNPINDIVNNSYSYASNGSIGVIDGVMQFVEYHFPTLKVKTDLDDYDLPCHFWFFGKDADDYKYTDAKLGCKAIIDDLIMAVYAEDAAEVTGKSLFRDAAADGREIDLTVIVNGTVVDDLTVAKADKNHILFDNGFVGATSYLLDMDGRPDGIGDTLIVKAPCLAKVVAITEAEERSITLEVYTEPGKRISVSYDTDEFERGDYVLVFLDDENEILDIELAETVAGKLSKINLTTGKYSSTITLDGTAYPAGSEALAVLGPDGVAPVYCDKELYRLREGYTAYLSNGYVIGVLADAIVFSDYVYVVKGDVPTEAAWYANVDNDKDIVGDSNLYKIAYLDLEGNLVETKGAKKAAGWYSNNTLKSKGPAKYLAEGVTISELNPKTPALGDENGYVVTNDATIFLLRTKTTTFERYVGIKNVPTYKTLPEGTVADAIVNNGFAVAVYIDLQKAELASKPAGAEDDIYIISLAQTKEDRNGDTIYTYNAIVDGKQVTVSSLEELLNADGEPLTGFVTPVYKDKENLILKSATDAGIAPYVGEVDFLENAVKLGGVEEKFQNAYYVNPDARAFIITGELGDEDVRVAKGSPTTLANNYGELTLIFDKNGKVCELYFKPTEK